MKLRFNRSSTALGVAAAFTLLAGVATAEPAAKKVLPFVEDDYARAISKARASKLPVFVEAWAPW